MEVSIFNLFTIWVSLRTDQGSQFTAEEFTNAVLSRGCKLSMDGKGAWRDNVFVEHLWRSVKYASVYLRAYGAVRKALTRPELPTAVAVDNSASIQPARSIFISWGKSVQISGATSIRHCVK